MLCSYHDTPDLCRQAKNNPEKHVHPLQRHVFDPQLSVLEPTLPATCMRGTEKNRYTCDCLSVCVSIWRNKRSPTPLSLWNILPYGLTRNQHVVDLQKQGHSVEEGFQLCNSARAITYFDSSRFGQRWHLRKVAAFSWLCRLQMGEKWFTFLFFC